MRGFGRPITYLLPLGCLTGSPGVRLGRHNFCVRALSTANEQPLPRDPGGTLGYVAPKFLPLHVDFSHVAK